MAKSDNRCAHCGGKFGLVCYHHWGLRFCRKACRDTLCRENGKGPPLREEMLRLLGPRPAALSCWRTCPWRFARYFRHAALGDASPASLCIKQTEHEAQSV